MQWRILYVYDIIKILAVINLNLEDVSLMSPVKRMPLPKLNPYMPKILAWLAKSLEGCEYGYSRFLSLFSREKLENCLFIREHKCPIR